HLIVIQQVVNDNGGTKTAADFAMTIGGVSATGGNTFPGAESPGTNKALTKVGAYTVTAGAVTGYTQTNASADCAGTIALGETRTCTITNDDAAPHLIVNPHVVNDNGGTLTAAAFAGTFTGVTAAAGATWAGASTDRTLTSVGSYTVVEPATPGYDASMDAGCAGTIALGEIRTCTVTNNDQAAHLIVITRVVNDNGGTQTAADFTVTIGGVTATGGSTFPGAESP